jgi:hypothetical protein
MDGLYVPTKTPWYAAFQQELLQFPVGKHDDQVDALGLIGQMLATLLVGQQPVNKARKFNPDKDAYRPFTSATQLDHWFRNEDDIGGETMSWKVM